MHIFLFTPFMCSRAIYVFKRKRIKRMLRFPGWPCGYYIIYLQGDSSEYSFLQLENTTQSFHSHKYIQQFLFLCSLKGAVFLGSDQIYGGQGRT